MILRVVIAFLIFYLLYRAAKMLFLPAKGKSDRPSTFREAITGEDLVEDPYCHTYVPLSSAYKVSIKGKTLYFCSRECFERYRSKKEREENA
jgi:YHS domain-containing protein